MKHTKKLFALLLAGILILGLGTPALAAVDWNAFVVAPSTSERQHLKNGEDIVLSVTVYAPEGTEVTYGWYKDTAYDSELSRYVGVGELLSTEPTYVCSPGDKNYPQVSIGLASSFLCIVTAVEKDAADNPADSRTRIASFNVGINPRDSWDVFKRFFGEGGHEYFVEWLLVKLFGFIVTILYPLRFLFK